MHPRANTPSEAEKSAREALASYYDLLELEDTAFGTILATLERLKLVDDTVVVFTSERGAQVGSHGLNGDDAPFEESVRVPLAIRYPRVVKAELKGLASQIDVLPTLTALCGIETPEGDKGRNLFAAGTAESVYSHGKIGTPGEWRMVVRGYDKLIVNKKGDATQIFNLAEDPDELTNLLKTMGERDLTLQLKRDGLMALLRVWMRKLGDGIDPSGLKKRP